ncbi:LysM peptidoglycan-binding domain-containing protein [Methylacidimicrobium sp. B4]|uniref:LysM peptidoglycan-binding domain-containing protein n=1 Tax=Methylacidimicrobium sp. B4 TaxID=2796139 RepID=UPI001A8F5A6D|nr:LysM peptidoglycan-binding domain-containing protein [Methylacidimicrobium sp. B4]QSR85668.1 LysM peptidoglycan-binding domain-containing protein [Methylacidimicrobium sp. B4]
MGLIALLWCGGTPRSLPAAESAAPSSVEAAAEPPPPGSTKYAVKQGDSLWKISRRFKITVEALRKANGLKNDRLQIGQELIVPPPSPKGKQGEAETPSGSPMPPSTPNPPAGTPQ